MVPAAWLRKIGAAPLPTPPANQGPLMRLPADLIRHIFSFLKGDSADTIASLLCKRAIVLHPIDPSKAERICQIAAARGQTAIVTWARRQGAYCGVDAAIAAAAGGHLRLLQKLRKENVPWDYRVCQEAAFHGHIDLLKWAIRNGAPWEKGLKQDCMRMGLFRVAEVLVDRRGGALRQRRWEQMALDTAKDINSSEPFRACDMAAIGGHLDVLKALRRHRVPWDAVTFEKGIRGKHGRVIHWLKKENCPTYDGCCDAAAAIGDKALLIWLKAKGCSWGPTTINEAAKARHFRLVHWLYRNGCPVNFLTFSCLAKEGNLSTLKWLYSKEAENLNREELGKYIAFGAADGGHQDVLSWLTQLGYALAQNVIANAASSGHYLLVQWAVQQGYPMTAQACASAAANGSLKILKFLRSRNCPWDQEAYKCAFAKGHLHIVTWALANGVPLNLQEALSLVPINNSEAMTRWVRSTASQSKR